MESRPMWATWLTTILLCACGGGGDSAPASRAPLATLSQDINPSGIRLDYRSRNYFPAATGDRWTYAVQQNGASTGQTITRTASASGSDFTLTETFNGQAQNASYRRTADGIVSILPLTGSVPNSVAQFIGNLLEYPEPFYPVGATRSMIRQGSLDEDLDGDGIAESFRLEMTQVFVGIETLGSLQNVAHFRNVTAFTVQPSNSRNASVTVTATEQAWWGPGMGLVRSDLLLTDSSGTVPTTTLSQVLTGGTVGGVALVAP